MRFPLPTSSAAAAEFPRQFIRSEIEPTMQVRLLILFFLASLALMTLSSGIVGQEASVTPPPSTAHPQLADLPVSVADAQLKSARGGPFKLSDYSGKVLVVNLWATWVGPSRLETPELVKLQAHFWSQGVRMVGLSTEDPEMSADEVHAWVRTYRIQYRIGWATPEVATTLMQGRDAIPQTFVISRSGRIVRRFVGFNLDKTALQFKQAVEEALNEKADSPEQH
jgi:peroxiredoxin